MYKYLRLTRIFSPRLRCSVSKRGDPVLLNGALDFMM